MKLRTVFGVGMIALVLPVGAAGQVDYSSLEVSGGYAGWTGDELELFDPGFRGQVNLFGGVSSTFAVALTGTWGRVPFAEVDTDGSEWGLGVTLRKAFGPPGTVRFFGDGYGGWTRISTDVEQATLTVDGFAFGPGAGVEIPLNERFKVIGRGTFHYHDYEDIRLNEGGPIASGGSGWRWAAYLGLSYGPLR